MTAKTNVKREVATIKRGASYKAIKIESKEVVSGTLIGN